MFVCACIFGSAHPNDWNVGLIHHRALNAKQTTIEWLFLVELGTSKWLNQSHGLQANKLPSKAKMQILRSTWTQISHFFSCSTNISNPREPNPFFPNHLYLVDDKFRFTRYITFTLEQTFACLCHHHQDFNQNGANLIGDGKDKLQDTPKCISDRWREEL